MDEDASEFLRSISKLKDGACVVANGSYSYDNWSHDYIFEPKALALLQKYDESGTNLVQVFLGRVRRNTSNSISKIHRNVTLLIFVCYNYVV